MFLLVACFECVMLHVSVELESSYLELADVFAHFASRVLLDHQVKVAHWLRRLRCGHWRVRPNDLLSRAILVL